MHQCEQVKLSELHLLLYKRIGGNPKEEIG